MNCLPLKRACDLTDSADQPKWLIEGLWADQAVGILGAEPKCCKSFLALDMAVSVASGTACLRRFPVVRTAPVLVFPAEDALAVVRKRLEGICAAAGTGLDTLPIYVITAPRLLLDRPRDQEQLRNTVAAIKPALLILDPFIRLHQSDENASKEMAPLLGYLRQLQRELHLAVLLVHHARKGSGAKRPGQALRGSSDLQISPEGYATPGPPPANHPGHEKTRWACFYTTVAKDLSHPNRHPVSNPEHPQRSGPGHTRPRWFKP